uniref:XK-related protein n=1 Tax=Tetranychus urticae TaxID=32264 RepID=T1JZ12_TETUR
MLFFETILQHSANLTHNSTTINSKPVKENNESIEYVNYYLLTINEDRDTALLSLIKSFSQSTPIVILQTYIIASTTTNLSLQRTIVMLQLASILSCLVLTSWSLASYHRALRRSIPEKGNMSSYGVILSFLWRLGTLTCRTMSIGLFISSFSYWILPIAIGHWGIMTIWVMHQGTHFCRHEQSEYLFNMILGLLYLFEFLNIKDEPTRFMVY